MLKNGLAMSLMLLWLMVVEWLKFGQKTLTMVVHTLVDTKYISFTEVTEVVDGNL